MADETPEKKKLAAKLTEGLKKQQAAKLSDTANTQGKDAAADQLLGND